MNKPGSSSYNSFLQNIFSELFEWIALQQDKYLNVQNGSKWKTVIELTHFLDKKKLESLHVVIFFLLLLNIKKKVFCFRFIKTSLTFDDTMTHLTIEEIISHIQCGFFVRMRPTLFQYLSFILFVVIKRFSILKSKTI